MFSPVTAASFSSIELEMVTIEPCTSSNSPFLTLAVRLSSCVLSSDMSAPSRMAVAERISRRMISVAKWFSNDSLKEPWDRFSISAASWKSPCSIRRLAEPMDLIPSLAFSPRSTQRDRRSCATRNALSTSS